MTEINKNMLSRAHLSVLYYEWVHHLSFERNMYSWLLKLWIYSIFYSIQSLVNLIIYPAQNLQNKSICFTCNTASTYLDEWACFRQIFDNLSTGYRKFPFNQQRRPIVLWVFIQTIHKINYIGNLCLRHSEHWHVCAKQSAMRVLIVWMRRWIA